jgi:hypothetical protein
VNDRVSRSDTTRKGLRSFQVAPMNIGASRFELLRARVGASEPEHIVTAVE